MSQIALLTQLSRAKNMLALALSPKYFRVFYYYVAITATFILCFFVCVYLLLYFRCYFCFCRFLSPIHEYFTHTFHSRNRVIMRSLVQNIEENENGKHQCCGGRCDSRNPVELHTAFLWVADCIVAQRFAVRITPAPGSFSHCS